MALRTKLKHNKHFSLAVKWNVFTVLIHFMDIVFNDNNYLEVTA